MTTPTTIASLSAPVAVTLTASQWDTIRVGVLLQSIRCWEEGTEDSRLFSQQLQSCYDALAAAVPPIR